MTNTGMVAMRQAATLAHALPGVKLRLSSRGRTLLEVGAPSVVDGAAMGPCAFRMAVARGHERLKQGCPIAFMELPPGEEPVVEVGLRPGDAALPGGIYRVASGEVHVQAFVTTLPLRHCRRVLSERQAPVDDDVDELGVGLRHDSATEITVVHTAGTPGMLADAQLVLLQDALGALAAEELLSELASTDA